MMYTGYCHLQPKGRLVKIQQTVYILVQNFDLCGRYNVLGTYHRTERNKLKWTYFIMRCHRARIT